MHFRAIEKSILKHQTMNLQLKCFFALSEHFKVGSTSKVVGRYLSTFWSRLGCLQKFSEPDLQGGFDHRQYGATEHRSRTAYMNMYMKT